MKVYHPEGSSQTLMITPGNLIHGEVPSEWKDKNGAAIRFDVRFERGVADVDKKLGEMLISQGYANRTSLKRMVNRLLTL